MRREQDWHACNQKQQDRIKHNESAKMSRMQTVYSKDTYHGFPVLPDDINGLTAVVAGISRAHMARAFSSIILHRTNGETNGELE